jgi:hypothetical protein
MWFSDNMYARTSSATDQRAGWSAQDSLIDLVGFLKDPLVAPVRVDSPPPSSLEHGGSVGPPLAIVGRPHDVPCSGSDHANLHRLEHTGGEPWSVGQERAQVTLTEGVKARSKTYFLRMVFHTLWHILLGLFINTWGFRSRNFSPLASTSRQN